MSVAIGILGEAAVEVAASEVMKRGLGVRWRFLLCRTLQRRGEIRVSYATLLRVSRGSNYVVIKNPYRKTLAPLGGVYKYRLQAIPALDELQWRPQAGPDHSDMYLDIRGMIPRKNILRFEDWFDTRRDRESDIECMNRELDEEFREARVVSKMPRLAFPQFRIVRTVREGPLRVLGRDYLQYRRLDVFELNSADQASSELDAAIVEAAKVSKRLTTVSRAEAMVGATIHGEAIAATVPYLFGTERVRGDEAPHPGAEL